VISYVSCLCDMFNENLNILAGAASSCQKVQAPPYPFVCVCGGDVAIPIHRFLCIDHCFKCKGTVPDLVLIVNMGFYLKKSQQYHLVIILFFIYFNCAIMSPLPESGTGVN
jgi:hypothetical protein